MKNVVRKKITSLPNITQPLDESNLPVIDRDDYNKRIHALFKLANGKYSHFIIYADREHFSNVEYFTGYDPRFEECLLILQDGKKPVLVVGNEGISYAARIPYGIDVVVYPAFSLPAQPRNPAIKLSKIFADAGVGQDSAVGIIGWKVFDQNDFADFNNQFDLPAFIMQELLTVTKSANLRNAVSLMVDNETGLRHNLCAKELVLCEVSGTKSSRSTYEVLKNLREGISELEASRYLHIDGDPISTHPNINFGHNYFYALASPSHTQRLKKGDIVGAGMAYRRSLCHKVSFFVEREDELDPSKVKEINRIYNTYFSAVSVWYESLGIGVTGGEVYENVKKAVGDYKAFNIGLNPGHCIHTEEWTNSPFYEGCSAKIHSGMAIQCDFTSADEKSGIGVHAEDGVVIADEEMRKAMSRIAPLSYARIQARQDFMRNVLGIRIADEVLPTSDIPGIVFPFLGDLSTVLANQ